MWTVSMFIFQVRHFRQIRREVPRVIYVVLGKAPQCEDSDRWKVTIPVTLSWGSFHCQQNIDQVKIGDPELWELTILAAKEWHVSLKQLGNFSDRVFAKFFSGTQICKRCHVSFEDQKTFHLLKTSSHRASLLPTFGIQTKPVSSGPSTQACPAEQHGCISFLPSLPTLTPL